jgi:signal transduction histidine kinase
MKIKTQVSISLIVFVILAIVILLSYFSSTNQLHELQTQQQIIDTIEKSAFELYYLENDYLISGGTLQAERWNSKYAELTGQLQDLTLTDPSQKEVLKGLVTSHRNLNKSFSNLVAVTGSVEGESPLGTSQELKEFSASTLAGQTHTLMSRSSELSQMVKAEAIEVEQRTTLVISSSIAVLMVFVLLNYLLINRSVLKSITALEKGAKLIGSGNLDIVIDTRSNDELDDLSFAITAMASNLKTVLTSKSDLEKEVFERKRAQEQLKESEILLNEVGEMAIVGGWEIDVRTKAVRWTKETYRIHEISEEERFDLSEAILFFDLPDRSILAAALQRCMELGEPFDLELPFTSAKGRHLMTRAIGRAGYIDGNLVKLTGTFQDITDRKRAENALVLASRKLNLLSSITRHDINNQLTVQMGYLSLLEKRQLDPTQKEYFRKVSTAAEQISAMIQFTKEYEEIGVKAPKWQDFRTLVNTAVKQVRFGKVIVKNYLPAGMEVFADPLIVKVCYNLIDNAVRYGGKITTIQFAIEERDGDQVIVCEDDGDGVPAGEKEKIFERGFGKNTGMGLFLAREILDITGITITETGEPGKGARFEMVVPKGMWRITGKGAGGFEHG